MSRKSKAKDQTKALNIPFTLTQADLVKEALAVAKDQTQALNIPVKVPLGGGRYAELTEWNDSKRVDLRCWKVKSLVQCYTSGGRFDQSSERRRTRGLEI